MQFHQFFFFFDVLPKSISILLAHAIKKTIEHATSDMVEEGILEFENRTGKGGHHRVYYPKMNMGQFAIHVVNIVTRKLSETFPSLQNE